MKIIKFLLLSMFVSQAALAQVFISEDEISVERINGFIRVYACGVNPSTATQDNTLTFYALVGNSLSDALRAYSPVDQAPVSNFERFADDDGCLDYMVQEADVPSYASLVVGETFSNNIYVLIKGQGQAPGTTPTPLPTPVPSNESYEEGYEAGQLVASVYNETLALVAYMRVLIADDLASEFQLGHVTALSTPAAYVTGDEADLVERQMYDRANREASSAAVNVARSEAVQLVTQAYTDAANNGTPISPSDINNLPTPNPVFTTPSISVGTQVSVSDITNPRFFNNYVERSSLNVHYHNYLEALFVKWPENAIFRSSVLFNYDGWEFQYIVDESRSFEYHLEVIGDDLSTSTPYNYVTGNRFNSNDERLAAARYILLRQIPSGEGHLAQNGFYQAFNDFYNKPELWDYRAILNEELNEHARDLIKFEQLIETEKAKFINAAAKELVLNNYKVEVFEEEFPVAFTTAANEMFLDNYLVTLDQQIERFETSTILDFSNSSFVLTSADELGLLSETSVVLQGVRNIGKKPASSISLSANVAGSNLGLNFPLVAELNFGELSAASTSASFEIPYNSSYLAYNKQAPISFSVGRTSVGSMQTSLTAKAYVANFAELFDDICPDNASREQKRICNSRKTDLGDLMGKEVREIGRQEQFNYYDSYQSGSTIWALTELDSSAELTDVLTHKYRRASSVRDRVESYKPGLFGNSRVKALFDDALGVIDNVAR